MFYFTRYDPKDFNRAVLVLGDSGGGVCIMEFSTATTCLFSSQPGVMENHRIAFPELLQYRHDGLRVTHMTKVGNYMRTFCVCFHGNHPIMGSYNRCASNEYMYA